MTSLNVCNLPHALFAMNQFSNVDIKTFSEIRTLMKCALRLVVLQVVLDRLEIMSH